MQRGEGTVAETVREGGEWGRGGSGGTSEPSIVGVASGGVSSPMMVGNYYYINTCL